MRVKIAANPPLPLVRAWFPLAPAHGQTISSFKSLLCASLPAFRDHAPASLHLSIDGFELLDQSELSVVRDGDLISVDVCEPPLPSDSTARTSHATPLAVSCKRKRPASTPSITESDTESSSSSESESESETSDSEGSEPDVSSVVPRVPTKERAPPVQPKPSLSTLVPPGYGKPQTRSRNLRRRRKRMYEHEATAGGASDGGPVSGANAVVPDDTARDQTDADEGAPTFMSLSLRNKNKAKNFKSLMNRPLPPKIVFGDQETVTARPQALPKLIPPSMRSSLPPNMFVTSVDVEAEETSEHEDVDQIEATANENWDTLARPTREIAPGTLVGYKALGIDPVTFTPGHVLTVGQVESCDVAVLTVRPLRAVSFHWRDKAEAEGHPWEEIDVGDWRVL